uniref:Uncharacterized protein n=1 Tax=Anguilla anguilla TaxID=7936 RepID=A0A0E9U981_ANGAN
MSKPSWYMASSQAFCRPRLIMVFCRVRPM